MGIFAAVDDTAAVAAGGREAAGNAIWARIMDIYCPPSFGPRRRRRRRLFVYNSSGEKRLATASATAVHLDLDPSSRPYYRPCRPIFPMTVQILLCVCVLYVFFPVHTIENDHCQSRLFLVYLAGSKFFFHKHPQARSDRRPDWLYAFLRKRHKRRPTRPEKPLPTFGFPVLPRIREFRQNKWPIIHYRCGDFVVQSDQCVLKPIDFGRCVKRVVWLQYNYIPLEPYGWANKSFYCYQNCITRFGKKKKNVVHNGYSINMFVWSGAFSKATEIFFNGLWNFHCTVCCAFSTNIYTSCKHWPRLSWQKLLSVMFK